MVYRLHGISHIARGIVDSRYAVKYHMLVFFTEYYLNREYGIRFNNGICPLCGVPVSDVRKHIASSRKCWYSLLKYVSEAYKVYQSVMDLVVETSVRRKNTRKRVFYCRVCGFRSELKFLVLVHVYEDHVKSKLV